MSRKDTIIIALLINAGLLALLFVLAVNTDNDSMVEQAEFVQTVAEAKPTSASAASAPTSVAIAKTAAIDEVDSFLKDLSSEESIQPIMIDEEGYIELDQSQVPTPAMVVAKQESSVDGNVKYVEVTVKRGDALEKIARSNGTTVEAIKKANNLSSAKLSIGQVLRVPVSQKSDSKPVVASTASVADKKVVAASEPQYYVIKSGDNPWKIARQFQVKFEDLLRMNDLDEEKARNLKVGDRIRVK